MNVERIRKQQPEASVSLCAKTSVRTWATIIKNEERVSCRYVKVIEAILALASLMIVARVQTLVLTWSDMFPLSLLLS